MSLGTAWARVIMNRARQRALAEARPSAELPGAERAAFETAVRPVLMDLEQLRRGAMRRIDLRALWMIPLGVAVGAGAGWLVLRDNPLFGAASGVLVGALGGWAVAADAPIRELRQLYKTRILPRLAAAFGALDYRTAREPDLRRLAEVGLLPLFGEKIVEDEIFGTYRGHRLSIVEARLETGGKHGKVVFNGLVVEIGYPGRFEATTLAKARTAPLREAFEAFLRDNRLERIDPGDPRFDERYQVYGNDPREACALLSPAVRARILGLTTHAGGATPQLLAEPGAIWVTLPKSNFENLFEPPSMAEPVDRGGGLVLLAQDIGSVLRLVDAVIDLVPTPAAGGAANDPA